MATISVQGDRLRVEFPLTEKLLGRWVSRGHRQLVALRRGRPAVYVALSGQKYDELLIETPDPVALVAQLGR